MRYDVLNLLFFRHCDGWFVFIHSVDFVSPFLFCFIRTYSWFSIFIFFLPNLIGMASDFYRWWITANEITSGIEHGFFLSVAPYQPKRMKIIFVAAIGSGGV